MSVLEKTLPIDQPNDKVVEIRLSDIIDLLKRSRRAMLIGAVIGLLLGGLYAFSKPNEYTSQVSVMPEIQAKGAGSLGSLGSLAGLAGVDVSGLTSAVDAVRPDLYPTVLESVPFALNLLSQPVSPATGGKPIQLIQYLDELDSHSLLGRLGQLFSSESNAEKNLITNKDLIQLTKEQEQAIKAINQRVTASYDKKTGIVQITSTMPDPLITATVTQQSLSYLTDYITSYRTGKASRQVTFLTQQVNAAKHRYQTAEYTLSRYRDQNRNLFLNTAKIEEQRLQADFMLAQGVYNELSKQLEQAKIKVQEDTPVFKMLAPPQVPLKKSGPKRSAIMLGFAVVGALTAFLRTAIRTYVSPKRL